MTGRVIPFRRRADDPDDDAEEFEEVARAGDRAEALVVQSLLEAHGIQVVVRTRIAQSVHPFTVGDQGEVRILVPRAAAPEGRRLLTRLASGPSLP